MEAEIRRTTWNGSIPLRIRLSPIEARNYDQTDPYLVRRYDYFINCYTQTHTHTYIYIYI